MIFSGAIAGVKVDVLATDRVLAEPVSASTAVATPAMTWLEVSDSPQNMGPKKMVH